MSSIISTFRNITDARYLFYMVAPWEFSNFKKPEDVPPYLEAGAPWMMLLILAEMFIDIERYQLNDTVTSICAGLCSMTVKFGGKFLSAALFPIVWQHINLVDMEPGFLAFIINFLAQDFAYYLGHRCIHEAGWFWGFHSMHHSSERYNFSTAIRQGALQDFAMVFFDLGLAVFVSPTSFMAHKSLNILYQFWIHTELVPPLGPLEYVLNTPSAHRVHHGRNPYCIDRNYAATLIIWDRMFGTYAAERPEEPVVYGLVTPVNSFNQLHLQFNEFIYYLTKKPFLKNEDGTNMFPGWKNKLRIMFAPPGEYPGVATKRFFLWHVNVDNEEGIPPVDYSNVTPYHKEISIMAKVYVIMNSAVLLGVAFSTILSSESPMKNLDYSNTLFILAFMLSTIQSFGYYFDHHYPFNLHFDFARLTMTAVISYLFSHLIQAQNLLPYSIVSLAFLTLLYLNKRLPGQQPVDAKAHQQ